MWLVTAQAIDFCFDLAVVRWVTHIGHRVTEDRMSQATLQRQTNHLYEVILRQLHFAIEDQSQVILGVQSRLGIRAVTLQAKCIAFCAQQFGMIAPVGIMTGSASLLERGLVQYLLAMQLGLIRVTNQADIDRVGFQKTGGSAGVRTVAVCAISGSTFMLNS